MTQTTQATGAAGWDRPELNVKLSKRRRDLMAAVAKRLPAGATPTEVIDHALAEAAAAKDAAGLDERLLDLGDAIELATMEQRLATASIEASVKELARGLEALRALIAEVASQDESF